MKDRNQIMLDLTSEITGMGILVTNKPLKTTSTIDKDIMLNNSPMKFIAFTLVPTTL